MIKKMRKACFYSIKGKCCAAIVLVGMIILLLCNSLLPHVFFHVLKPFMIDNMSLLMSGAANKISYILRENIQYEFAYCNNTELIYLCKLYFDAENKDKSIMNEKVSNYFQRMTWGISEPGSIQYNQDMGLIVNGSNVFAKEGIKEEVEAVSTSLWYKQYCKGRTESERFYRAYMPQFEVKKDGKVEKVIAYCLRWYNEGQSYDTVMIQESGCYSQILNEIENVYKVDCAILLENQEIFFTNQESSYFESVEDNWSEKLFRGSQYKVNYRENKDSMDFVVLTSYQTEGVHLAIHVTKDALMGPWKDSIAIFNIIVIFIILFIITIVFLILRRNLNHLNILSRNMEKVEEGIYDQMEVVESNDEVGMLSNAFNDMSQKVKFSIEEIVRHQENEKRIQYSLLVSQIDPHFIYNTLNTITYLAKLNRANDIMKLNLALIIMLKDRLKMKQYKSFDTIANEMKIIQQYMLIQSYLYYKPIVCNIEYNKEQNDVMIPKNVIQPLVENAILHGLSLKQDEEFEARIGIQIECREEVILLRIQDNGRGMSQEEIYKYFEQKIEDNFYQEEENTHTHIGIYNIRMRLDYLYEKDYRMYAYCNQEGGLTVEICLLKKGKK